MYRVLTRVQPSALLASLVNSGAPAVHSLRGLARCASTRWFSDRQNSVYQKKGVRLGLSGAISAFWKRGDGKPESRLMVAVLFLCLCLFLSCTSIPPNTVRVQLILDWKAQMEHAGFFVALDKGFYLEEGLHVELLEGNGAPTTARVVGNGTYNLGVASGSATVMARVAGIPIVSLAVINQHTPVVVYALAEKGINTPQDLIGKRIGVNIGGTKHREFQALLKKLDIPETSIQLMGMSEASPAPLLAGQVDAMLGYTEDQPVTVELRGQAVSRIALSDYGIDVYSTNIIANQSFLKENPDLVRKFMRATVRGWEHAIAHPEEAVAAYMAKRPESDEAFNRTNFKYLTPLLHSPDTKKMGFGAQTEARWAYTQDVLFDLGMIEKKEPVNALFTNEFLTDSGDKP